MELIDNMFVIQVQENVMSIGEIRAKKEFKKIHEMRQTTANVNVLEVITYKDIAYNVHWQILEILK